MFFSSRFVIKTTMSILYTSIQHYAGGLSQGSEMKTEWEVNGLERNETFTIHIWYVCTRACSVPKLCLTPCNPRDCSLPGSSIHGTFQARILEWVVIFFSRGSSQSRDLPDIISLHSWMQFVNILFRIFETLFTVRSACNFSSLLIHFGRWILLPLSHLGGPDMYL